MAAGKRLTTQEFIDRARAKHGDRYDYSRVKYTNVSTKVKIICSNHGEFLQAPEKHLFGRGCPSCKGGVRSNSSDFVRKAKALHGDLYDYAKVNYTNNHTKVTILCKAHGAFSQVPNSHLAGNGCSVCARGKVKSNTEDFIEKSRQVHGCKYDYSLVDYSIVSTKVKLICKHHGIFMQTPNSHLRGVGCRLCGLVDMVSKTSSTTVAFIEKSKRVHGDKYNYSLVDYLNVSTKVKIVCKDHGEFLQTPNSHLRGKGCPGCFDGGYSKRKPGRLYYVRFDLPGLTLWKIGITNLTVEKRFSRFKVKPVTIWDRIWDDGCIAAREELRILKGGVYDQYRYTGPNVLENGNTECFTIDIMQLGNTTRVEASAA
jgi:hypothetical protein